MKITSASKLKSQMGRSVRWIILAATILHAVPTPASEAAEILGLWEQVATNAGACRTCTIEFQAGSSGLSVTANNGWAASLRGLDKHDIVGTGRWEDRGRACVSGKPFTVSFRREGNHLEMTMIIDTGADPKPVVRSTYRRAWQGV
jgi:hypothetical protein